jgi:hypothetical protein
MDRAGDFMPSPVTICVLTYGDHEPLARCCLESIRFHCARSLYRLVVGANAVGDATWAYLRERVAAGDIDRLCVSPANINKNPMMRRMLEGVDTELVWWFDDDSYVTGPEALPRRLEIARAAPESTVGWGHKYFFSHEDDFNLGLDAVEMVRRAPWYRGLSPPSWAPGGKGETDFEGRGTGDGRWFFLTGGCWVMRTAALRALDWPDPRLVIHAEDVILGEAVRQQGWSIEDIGSLGVAINTQPTRGSGKDLATFARMMEPVPAPSASPVPAPSLTGTVRGCLFIPTFRDTDRLEENFGGRPEAAGGFAVVVGDDNDDPAESARVADLCARNGWRRLRSGRSPHGTWMEEAADLSGLNRFVWERLTALAEEFDVVVKMDTDAFVIDGSWSAEMAARLAGRAVALGTPEARATRDVLAFWDLARAHGHAFDLGPVSVHLQGGIVGFGREALLRLRAVGFPEGRHAGVADDGCLSYACALAGIPLETAETTGSWYGPYRPPPERLRGLKAVHPMRRAEWEQGLKPQMNTDEHG